jgi:hypothetical protein
MFKRDTGTAKRQTGTAEAVEGGKRGTQNLAPQKDLTVNFTEFNVTLLTDGFQTRAVMRCIGLLAIYLNDDSKPTFPLYNAELVGLDPTNPATRVVQEEAFFRKPMCHVIAFENIPGEGHVVLLPREEALVVYTSHYAIQGKFHLGPDDRVGEFMEVQLSQFVTISDVHIYPLFQPRTPMIAAAPLVMMHRSLVRMYHKVGRS